LILYTNKKLLKIGSSENEKCNFCDNESETFDHLFFIVPSQIYFGQILKVLSFQDIILGILTSPCPLLNYIILMGKLYIWDCKRKHIHPYIEGFKQKIKIYCQTEKYIASKNNDLVNFYKKWPENILL